MGNMVLSLISLLSSWLKTQNRHEVTVLAIFILKHCSGELKEWDISKQLPHHGAWQFLPVNHLSCWWCLNQILILCRCHSEWVWCQRANASAILFLVSMCLSPGTGTRGSFQLNKNHIHGIGFLSRGPCGIFSQEHRVLQESWNQRGANGFDICYSTGSETPKLAPYLGLELFCCRAVVLQLQRVHTSSQADNLTTLLDCQL